MKPTEILFFDSAPQFRSWLRAHHTTSLPVWIALSKRGCTHHVLAHQDALDTALCFGWIDGIIGRIDSEHYALRFSQRRVGSNWSSVNVCRFNQLRAMGMVESAGLRAFDARDLAVSEDTPAQLDETDLAQFKSNAAAWAYFERQPPGYRRQASWYVQSARTPATRQRRLLKLIELCSIEKRLPGYE